MMSKSEGKITLGKIFLNKYGKDFVSENKEYLGTLDTLENNDLFVKFVLYDKNVELTNKIVMGSNNSSKVLMVCSVKLDTEETKIYE